MAVIEARSSARDFAQRAANVAAYLTGPPRCVAGAGDATLTELFDAMVKEPSIKAASRQLFVDGHMARAVETAFKCLNSVVRRRSGLVSKDGADLMFHAFDVDDPVLSFNPLRTVSDRDEQAGLRLIMAGAMKGFRNPRAHEHDLEDDAQSALEMIVLASHLMGRLHRCRRRSRVRATSTKGISDQPSGTPR